jgi:hypothetical protein
MVLHAATCRHCCTQVCLLLPPHSLWLLTELVRPAKLATAAKAAHSTACDCRHRCAQTACCQLLRFALLAAAAPALPAVVTLLAAAATVGHSTAHCLLLPPLLSTALHSNGRHLCWLVLPLLAAAQKHWSMPMLMSLQRLFCVAAATILRISAAARKKQQGTRMSRSMVC